MADASFIPTEKKRLRTELRRARRALSEGERDALSIQITRAVTALPAWTEARTVMIYVALSEEVETLPLLTAALKAKKRLCVPRLEEDGTMAAILVERFEDLAASDGPLNLVEPRPGTGREIDPREIDLNLVPCVAVDRAGHRLGLGGGHYDRFLPRLRPDSTSIGLVFECQVVDALPHEDHDARLGGYASENGVQFSMINDQ